jgi:DNA-binding PadR family transcriptional regulator
MLLLASLKAGPAHGYALSASLRQQSSGALEIMEGSLYPALHRLEEAGMVGSVAETADGRRRRRYEITDLGEARLAEETRSWEVFKTVVDNVLREAVCNE